MTRRRFAALALALAACGGPPPSTPLPAAPRPAPAQVVASAPELPRRAETALPPATYDDKGRRDPFQQLETPGGPKGLTVSSTRLTGIVWGQRAVLALVEGSDGIGYILRAGDTLGDGRLIEIGTESAVFTVVPRPGAPPTRVTLRLSADS